MEAFTGPQFLVYYAALCVAVVVFGAWFVRSKDTSADGGPEPLAKDLDPYEIAYLRGGQNELVRYLVFELTRDGLLEVVPAAKKNDAVQIARTSVQPSSSTSELANIVCEYFVTPHTAQQLFASQVPAQIEQAYRPARVALESRGLFTDDNVRFASRTMRLVGSIIVLGGLFARLWYAIVMHHRNVIFMCIIALIAIVLLFVFTSTPRVSKRGRRYLESLRASLPVSSERAAIASPAFGLVVAAAGVAALAGTPYAALGDTFKRQTSSSSGGCGSSSSSCGSGGGGDGGGCGGGGCGG